MQRAIGMHDTKYRISERFSGNVVFAERVKIPAVLTLEHDKYDPSEIKGNISPAGIITDPMQRMWLQNPGIPQEIIFEAQSPLHTHIRLRAFSSVSRSRGEISFVALICEFGLSDFSIKETEFAFVTIMLTGAKCLSKWGRQTHHYNGNIELKPGYPEEIQWQTPFGVAEARMNYVYEEEIISGDKAVVQMRMPSISVKLDLTKPYSVKEVMEGLKQEMHDVCLLFALCSRQRVDWFDIGMTLRVRGPHFVNVADPKIRQSANKIIYSERFEELINHRDLVSGGFENLLAKFRASPHSELLRRTIPFIVVSYAPGFTETKFFLCYSALNALCDSIAKIAPELSEAQWKRVESELKMALQEILTKEGKTDMFELMAKKIPEIKRAPEMDVVLDAIARTRVKVDDLWENKPVATGLNEARKMRNALFHAADRTDIFEMEKNLTRLRILTERLTLNLLAWPTEKIWKWYDQELH